MIGTSKNIWGFDPRTIPGCVVWLDADDTSTLTLSGSNITAWRDKSSLNNNVNSISAIPPTYNSTDSSVNFVATSGTFLRGTMSATYSNSVSVFVVASIATQTSPAFPRLSMIGLSSTANSILIGQQLYVNGGNTDVITFLSTNTNPTGFGTNIMTIVNNVTYSTRQVITNVSSYIGTTYTISTFLNGDPQITTRTTRTGNFTASGTNVATYNKYSLANYPDAASTGGDSYSGKIFEYLVFNSALTTAQRQQIEGYLTWKWGRQTSMPITQPYRYVKPCFKYFEPTGITGCELWFDGGDYRTMFQNTAGTTPVTDAGQSVACWRDKIRNLAVTDTGISGRASVAPTSVSGGGLFFNNVSTSPTSTTQSLGAFSSGATNQTSFLFRMPNRLMTLFVASLPNSNNGYRRICLMGSFPLSGGPPNFLIGPQMGASEGGTIAIDLNSGQSAWAQIMETTTGYNSNTVLRIDALTVGTTGSWVTNGTSNTPATNTSYSGTNSNYPVNFLYLAGYSSTIDGGRSFHGNIYEILLYSRSLSLVERQTVEGYLAWKWGLTASLPATHLYKTIPTALITPPIVDPLINATGNFEIFIAKYDPNGSPLWARRIGGTSGTAIEYPNSIATDSSGNVIIVVESDVNPVNVYNVDGTTVLFTLNNSGSTDGYVIKYNSSGTPLWARRLGGTINDFITSVSTDSSGNIVVVGSYVSNPLNIFAADGTTVSLTLATVTNNRDAFVVKYDPNGTPLWARRIGGVNSETVKSVSIDSSGNIVVFGDYSNTLNVYAANGSTVLFTVAYTGSGLPNDAFVVKYDPNGTALWGRRISASLQENAASVSIDSSQNIIVCGNYTSRPTDVFAANGTTVSFTLNNAGTNTTDGFVVKYDPNGTPLWARRLGGGTLNDKPNSVSTDSSGNVIVVGDYISSQFDIYNGSGFAAFSLVNTNGNSDSFVVKYDSSGTPLWARRFGGLGNEIAFSVSTDSSGNVIVFGTYTSNPMFIYAADGTTQLSTLPNSGTSSSDTFLIKYDPNGTLIWTRKMSLLNIQTDKSVATDSNQNIIVTGRYVSNPHSFYG